MHIATLILFWIEMHVCVSQGKNAVTKAGGKPSVVVAFDFGTSYSGYAYSFGNDTENILAVDFGAEFNYLSLKTATSVLLNPQKELHAFGGSAEDTYKNLTKLDDHHGWMLFREFKMLLHNNTNLTIDATVEDINGKSMPAMTIFAMSLHYLKENFLNAISLQVANVSDYDIQYILAVPAAWDDAAKQVMREAAMKAGMDCNRLRLALEPETVSIWYQRIHNKTASSNGGIFEPKQYMVLDAGGGVADIIVHERNAGDTLQEIHRSIGGPWGSRCVDKAYIAWLTKIFGADTLTQCKMANMSNYLAIQMHFEIIKRTVGPDSQGMIYFPVSLDKDISDVLVSLNLTENVTYDGTSLGVASDIVKGWFEEPIENIINHIQSILLEPSMNNVTAIVVAGGFGRCQLMLDALMRSFSNITIVTADHEDLETVKGSVLFGHFPSFVSARVVMATYGYPTEEPFDIHNSIHNRTKTVLNENGELLAINIFQALVTVDTVVPTGMTVEVNVSLSTGLDIFTSSDSKPELTTDANCRHIGKIDCSTCAEQQREQNRLVHVVFGDTELQIRRRPCDECCKIVCL